MDGNGFDRSKTAWISKGFEQLIADRKTAPEPFDVLIVGSGYGGAIAADTFSQYVKIEDGKTQSLKIAVLERGAEYLAGAFPANSTELPGHVRHGRQTKGLFDFRPGPEVSTLVANGVGGGSLINAGVMIEPDHDVFAKGWPDVLSDFRDQCYYRRAALLLGSRKGTTEESTVNSIQSDLDGEVLAKHKALQTLAGPHLFQAAAVTVAAEKRSNFGNVRLDHCIRCGDCATGCNHNAKDSLDLNLLYRAHCRGVTVYRGATVLHLERDDNAKLWLVSTVHTDRKLRTLQGEALPIPALHVVLAAGTLGTTEILKRSESDTLRFSRMLGQRCSTNGDAVIGHYGSETHTNAVGRESDRPSARKVGPTITGILDLRKSKDPILKGLLVEELAVPASLRRLFQEIFTTGHLLQRLGDVDGRPHESGFPIDDLYEVRDAEIDRSALYAVMGDDGAGGEIELCWNDKDDTKSQADTHKANTHQDGVARIRWSNIGNHPLFERQLKALDELVKEAGMGGKIIPNPLWRLLPDNLRLVAEIERGPVITVHPLGGCVMADSSSDGVVNHLGQVFEGNDTTAVYDELVVMDGSIIPTSLSANPALTIAALALRASSTIADTKWGYQRVAAPDENPDLSPPTESPMQPSEQVTAEDGASEVSSARPAERPVFRKVQEAFDPTPTKIRFTERMSGHVRLRGNNGVRDYVVELTLRFVDKRIAELTQPSAKNQGGTLVVDTGILDPVVQSKIRIYQRDAFESARRHVKSAHEMEDWLNRWQLWSSPINSGTLIMFKRQPSTKWSRILSGGWAWLLNHGLRDIWQAWRSDSFELTPVRQLLCSGIALASRAGESRKITYQLSVANALPPEIASGTAPDWEIEGEKEFTYAVASNPWNQLMHLRLTRFPGLATGSFHRGATLSLDLAYLARIRTPLIEITSEHDGVTAIAELGSLLAYITRLTIGIHAWSFRAPDMPQAIRIPKRLPGKIPDVPPPEIHEIFLGRERPHGSRSSDGDKALSVPVYVRLTRYARHDSTEPPLVMLHGYSASGTTFAHPAVRPNFAEYFHARNRDVWVIDLRTSCGMPTARLPWSFEQVAYRDIPEAIRFVCENTGSGRRPPQVDVIAHCMGAAMFSMALLYSREALKEVGNRDALTGLHRRIRRVAFTQVSPLVVLSPANIFRAYVLRFLRELLPDSYEFNPGPNASTRDKLLDRFLTTLPYPENEFRIENPLLPWATTPWTRTRHRMDALYGRVFNARHVGKKVLNCIDDFFGPMSVDTVAQTVHFARYNMITDAEGINRFVSRGSLAERWDAIPLFCLNSAANGLADVATACHTNQAFKDAGRSFQHEIIEEGAGHQDCLIGKEPRRQTLEALEVFFDRKDSELAPIENVRREFVVYTPWIGPLITQEPGSSAAIVRVGARPTHREPMGIILTRVNYENGVMGPAPPASEIDEEYLLRYSLFLLSHRFRKERWVKFALPPDHVAPASAGNAWLVTIAYNEAALLSEFDEGLYRYPDVDSQEQGGGAYRLESEVLDYADSLKATSSKIDPVGELPTNVIGPVVRKVITNLIEDHLYKPMIQGLLRVVRGDLSCCAEDDRDCPVDEVNGNADRSAAPSHPADLQGTTGPSARSGPANASGPIPDRLTEENVRIQDGLIPDLPPPRPRECSFLLTSCQYPPSLLDAPSAYRSYKAALDRRKLIGTSEDQAGDNPIVPRFGIFAGDQIYADASAGLFDPSIKNGRYELPYQIWLRNPFVRNLVRQIPSYMLLDDHEIDDNWEPLPWGASPGNAELLRNGYNAYLKYQRGIPTDADNAPFGNDEPVRFVADGFHFHMLDTRSARSVRGIPLAQPTMVPNKTIDHLIECISVHRNEPQFVVTPSMVLPRHRLAAQWGALDSAIRSDGWDGYPHSLFRLLKALADAKNPHIVFLSGDEHLPCFTEFVLTRKGDDQATVVHSIHTAAAHAPFPFANAKRENHLDTENLYFDWSGDELRYESDVISDPDPEKYGYRCNVKAYYPSPGDAMTLMRLWNQNGKWSLRCEFAQDIFTKPDISVAGPPDVQALTVANQHIGQQVSTVACGVGRPDPAS